MVFGQLFQKSPAKNQSPVFSNRLRRWYSQQLKQFLTLSNFLLQFASMLTMQWVEIHTPKAILNLFRDVSYLDAQRKPQSGEFLFFFIVNPRARYLTEML